MSDTQAQMREFRFLEEKRTSTGLTPAEAERWQALAAELGIDLSQVEAPPQAEQAPQGYYGQDGQWYPYPPPQPPQGYDPAVWGGQQGAWPGYYPPPQGYYDPGTGAWYPYPQQPTYYDPNTGAYYPMPQGYGYPQQWAPPQGQGGFDPSQQQPWPQAYPQAQQPWPGQAPWPAQQPQEGYPQEWPEQQQEQPPPGEAGLAPEPSATAPFGGAQEAPQEVAGDEVMEIQDEEVVEIPAAAQASPAAPAWAPAAPAAPAWGGDPVADLRQALSMEDDLPATSARSAPFESQGSGLLADIDPLPPAPSPLTPARPALGELVPESTAKLELPAFPDLPTVPVSLPALDQAAQPRAGGEFLRALEALPEVPASLPGPEPETWAEAAPVEAAPLEAAVVLGAPPAEAAPLEADLLEAPPAEAAPLEAALVEAPPARAAPLEAAPVEAPPRAPEAPAWSAAATPAVVPLPGPGPSVPPPPGTTPGGFFSPLAASYATTSPGDVRSPLAGGPAASAPRAPAPLHTGFITAPRPAGPASAPAPVVPAAAAPPGLVVPPLVAPPLAVPPLVASPAPAPPPAPANRAPAAPAPVEVLPALGELPPLEGPSGSHSAFDGLALPPDPSPIPSFTPLPAPPPGREAVFDASWHETPAPAELAAELDWPAPSGPRVEKPGPPVPEGWTGSTGEEAADAPLELAGPGEFVPWHEAPTPSEELPLEATLGDFEVESGSAAALATGVAETPTSSRWDDRPLELATNAEFIPGAHQEGIGEAFISSGEAVELTEEEPLVEGEVIQGDLMAPGEEEGADLDVEDLLRPSAPEIPTPVLLRAPAPLPAPAPPIQLTAQPATQPFLALTAPMPGPAPLPPHPPPAAAQPFLALTSQALAARAPQPFLAPPAAASASVHAPAQAIPSHSQPGPTFRPSGPLPQPAPSHALPGPITAAALANQLGALPSAVPMDPPGGLAGGAPPRAEDAPVPVPGEHRVILHTMEGGVKRGAIRDANLTGPQVVLFTNPGVSETVPRDRVKAIFFMLAPGSRAPAADGLKVRVTFRDGRQVAGYSRDHRSGAAGFFVVPADARTNTERIFIYRHGVTSVSVES